MTSEIYVYVVDMPSLSVHVQSTMQCHSCSYSSYIMLLFGNLNIHTSLLSGGQAVVVEQVCLLRLSVSLSRQLRFSNGPIDAWMPGSIVKSIILCYYSNIDVTNSAD